MTKRVKNLEKLAEIINNGAPVEVLFDLGEGTNRSVSYITYIDGKTTISDRIESSPKIRMYNEEGITFMDITDPTDKYQYEGLTPQGAVFEESSNPPYDLGDLTVDLGEGKTLGITHFYRPE